MIPGLNLLAVAAGVIATQSVEFRAWLSRSRSPAGEWVNTYAPDTPIRGSWQPVDMQRIAQLGLDMKKEYRQLWTSQKIQGVSEDPARGVDQVVADGALWEPTRTAGDWHSVDGWNQYIFVRVKAVS